MDSNQILKEVEEIFKDVLGNDDIHLTPDSSARDIDEWDSLSHIQLVIAVEKHFKIKFTSGEHPKWKKVGDMIANIERKLNGV